MGEHKSWSTVVDKSFVLSRAGEIITMANIVRDMVV
jgi:hypothetical protein